MSEIHEAIEKAQEGEHGEGFNKRIALVIAILAILVTWIALGSELAVNTMFPCPR